MNTCELGISAASDIDGAAIGPLASRTSDERARRRAVVHMWSQVCAEPFGQFCFSDPAGGDACHEPDCVHAVKAEDVAVVGQEQAGDDPSGAFVAVQEAVVPGYSAGAVAVATNSTDEAGEELIEGLRRANFAASRGSDRRTESILAGALVGALLGMLFGTDWEDAGEMQAASVSRESARGDQALARQLALVTGKRQEFQKQQELEGED